MKKDWSRCWPSWNYLKDPSFTSKPLSEGDCLAIREAAIIMYALALRIFQLKALRWDMLVFKQDEQGIWCGWLKDMPAKVGDLERKQINPKFIQEVIQIVNRRKALGVTCLFQQFGTYKKGMCTVKHQINILILVTKLFLWMW